MTTPDPFIVSEKIEKLMAPFGGGAFVIWKEAGCFVNIKVDSTNMLLDMIHGVLAAALTIAKENKAKAAIAIISAMIETQGVEVEKVNKVDVGDLN